MDRDLWDRRYAREKNYRGKPPHVVVQDFFRTNQHELVDKKVLEIGCGTGRNLGFLLKNGVNMVGVDHSEEALRLLQADLQKEQLPAQLAKGDVHKLPFGDGTFDAAICINVLPYNDWAGAEKAFEEMSRVVKNGGKVATAILSASSDVPEDADLIQDRGITYVPRTGSKAGMKIHLFTREELIELAEQHFFKVVEIEEQVGEKDGAKDAGWKLILEKVSQEK